MILVNLTCGRNPWKRASVEDSTFRAYLKDSKFLKSILPLSSELDAILRRIFECDPQKRITIPQLRNLIIRCPRFTTRAGVLPPSPSASVDYNRDSIYGGLPDFLAPFQQFAGPSQYGPPSPPAEAVTAQFSHLTTSSGRSSASDAGSVFSVTSSASSSSSHSDYDYDTTTKVEPFPFVAPPPQAGFYGTPSSAEAAPKVVPQSLAPGCPGVLIVS